MVTSNYRYKVDNKMRYYGDTDFEKKLIRINKKRNRKGGSPGELLDTIVHETMHAKNPKASEKKVISMTDKATRRMSPKIKRRYYNKIK